MLKIDVKLPNNWKFIKFQDIFAEKIRNGIYKKKEFHGRGYKIINMGELFKYDFISNQNMKRIELNEKEKKKYYVAEGDLLFARRSLILGGSGKCSIVLNPSELTTFESSIIRVRLDKLKVNPLYYFYFFKSPFGRSLIASISTRTAVSGIRGSDLAVQKVPMPPKWMQNKIANILYTFDHLIEVNLRRIQVLEEMAKSLFNEWFVHFRYPGHENTEKRESEFGQIPKNWQILSLRDILKTLESGSRPKGGIDPNVKEVPSIGAENIIGLGKYDYSKEKFVTREFYEEMKKGHVISGDVLLYKDGAHIGRKSMFRDGFPHKECCINEHVFILRTTESCTQNYLYFWLDRSDITQKIKNLNTNVAQPGINKRKVYNLPILIPDKKTLYMFEENIDPLMAQLFNFAKQNNLLRKIRDLLIPKLTLGEIDVSALEIQI